uniref:Pericentrin-like n=1 Tax=Phascolarctos cinereus TaxID=38626 RepID=A0A6P5JNS8_PHACI|nr:pericentrin-like [Phascolarctos cinereus]
MFQRWQLSEAEISEAICPVSYSYEESEAGFEPRASFAQEALGERVAIRTYSQSWSVPEKLQAKEGQMDQGSQSDPQKELKEKVLSLINEVTETHGELEKLQEWCEAEHSEGMNLICLLRSDMNHTQNERWVFQCHAVEEVIRPLPPSVFEPVA